MNHQNGRQLRDDVENYARTRQDSVQSAKNRGNRRAGNVVILFLLVATVVVPQVIYLAKTFGKQSEVGLTTTVTLPSPPRITSFKLAFLGDVAFSFMDKASGRFERGVAQGVKSITDPVQDILRSADETFANLETPAVLQLSDVTPPDVTQFKGKEKPQAWFVATLDDLHSLRKAGVTAVSLANNHWYDIGSHGHNTTQLAKSAGMVPLGSPEPPRKKEAVAPIKPKVFSVGDGSLIAVFTMNAALDVPFPCHNLRALEGEATPPCLAYNKDGGTTRHWKLNPTRVDQLLQAVRDTASTQQHTLIVVYIHWGTQFQQKVEPWQVDLAERLLDAGCHLIVGHHPHMLHGIRAYPGQGLVAYSLGSALWPYGASPSGILTVVADQQSRQSLQLEVCLIPTEMRRGSLQLSFQGNKTHDKITALSRQLGGDFSFHACTNISIVK